VAFAQQPMDSRSACVSVLAADAEPRTAVEACRPLGTPIVFVCFHDSLQWWKQGATAAEWIESIPVDRVDGFFDTHQHEFSPEAVYRAKTLGRIRTEYQLSFVDVGLMPLVEEQLGQALSNLIERNVAGMKSRLGWSEVTAEQGHWLLKSIFLLVSGKVLRDKGVPRFEDLEIADVEAVFSRVAGHYGTNPLNIGSKQKLKALEESARAIDRFSSLALTTTESLAFVYENTLIEKETRTSLGTHSTPSYLVDYIVGNLADWIKEIAENDRSVFEPACGHAAFLVSAMRLLTQLLPPEKAIPSRRSRYLRSRLHGTDLDPFALELARLSLTLADIPNPDGWDLRVEDMFVGERLAERARETTILLANPPFGSFQPHELAEYARTDTEIGLRNKAAELLRRTLPALQPGSVFGLVVPQTLLHAASVDGLRRNLLEHFELRDVSLFPDKVFSFSDAESAILLGRRLRDGSRKTTMVRYSRIRERQMPQFRANYDAPTARTVEQSRFSESVRWDMRIPDLEEVWLALAKNPTAGMIAELMKGLEFQSEKLRPGVSTYSGERFPGGQQGYIRLERGLQIHQLPKLYWMNLANEAVLRRRGSGATVDVPQVLLNYARVSRGPWRLKALIDRVGRPVASRFLTARPRTCSIESLWALLNSPVANAYAFCHLGKRDNIVGDIRRIPMPEGGALDEIGVAARAYLDAAAARASAGELRTLALRLDASVLRQYALPVELERALLSLFTGWDRVGVPFKQERYFPAELNHSMRLSDFVAYESDWPSANRRRGALIDKEIAGTISKGEAVELAALQAYADYYLEKVAPRPTRVLDELENRVFGKVTVRRKDS
jgi:hypothetical protein